MSGMGGWEDPKRLRMLTIFAVIAPLLTAFVMAGPVVAAQGRVAGAGSLNIRSCAALDCDVIANAALGSGLEITGSSVNGFLPVKWSGQTGYAYATYVNNSGVAPWFVEGDVSCRRVAFAFNIGIGYTPSQAILDTLVQKNAAATMFPMGWWAKQFPEYLRSLDAAGFAIGTHGDQPVMLSQLGDDRIRADVRASISAIEEVIGRPIDPYHTPYAADTNNRVRTVVSDLGLLPVGWNVAAADYGSGITESYVYNRVMNGVYPGAIVEFHLDGPATPQSTARALPRIIDDLRAAGYQIVSIPDMAVPCSTGLPTTADSAVVVNTGGAGLRCRLAPSSSASVLGVAPEGSRVPVRGSMVDHWVPVSCSGRSGWMHDSYLRLEFGSTATPPPEPSPTDPSQGITGTVSNTGGANLRCRRQPNTTSEVIVSLAPGTVVAVRGGSQSSWTPIVCNDQNGFVSSLYLAVHAAPPTASAYARVTGTGSNNLRCRSGAGSTYSTIMLMPPATRVELRGAVQTGWLPIRCGGLDGWASAAYLTIEP